MKAYLVQHAKALPKSQDLERPLSDQGRTEALKMARFVARLNITAKQLRHSGKTRARQTAEIYADALVIHPQPTASEGLAPNDDVAPLAREISAGRQDIMIVGHMPFLGRLAALLLTGRESPMPVAFHNAGIVCLERTEEDQWQVQWAVSPDLLAE